MTPNARATVQERTLMDLNLIMSSNKTSNNAHVILKKFHSSNYCLRGGSSLFKSVQFNSIWEVVR